MSQHLSSLCIECWVNEISYRSAGVFFCWEGKLRVSSEEKKTKQENVTSITCTGSWQKSSWVWYSSCEERSVLKSDLEWSFSRVLTAWPLKPFIRRPGFFSWFYSQASTLFPVLMKSHHGFLTCRRCWHSLSLNTQQELDLKAKV